MSFLDNYQALKQSIPIPALVVSGLEDCEYVDYTHHSKNCQYCFSCHQATNCIYCSQCLGSDLVDSLFTVFGELCYECVDCMKCYSSIYLQNCTNCRDCHYSISCVNCTDCFGCVALSHKQYCIFNKQLTKEEYDRQIQELKRQSSESILERVHTINRATPQPASLQRSNVNCPYGNNLNNSNNVYWGFDTYYLDNSGYIYLGGIAKDCWDMYYGGGNTKGIKSSGDVNKSNPTELCYELVGAGSCYSCTFLEQCSRCTNCHYSSYLRNCTDCFGCVGLTNKKYCFLNNQLTREQYKQATKTIKTELGWTITT